MTLISVKMEQEGTMDCSGKKKRGIRVLNAENYHLEFPCSPYGDFLVSSASRMLLEARF